ncbi:MAG: hypothetical protein IJ783_08565, partial [Kiritimatiellae bacterium]|nr:hypothetical protein [Kiritimatiellia bacterium]
MDAKFRKIATVALCAALLFPASAPARPHGGPRGPHPHGPVHYGPGPRHFHHHSWHGGDWAALGLVGLGIGAVAA